MYTAKANAKINGKQYAGIFIIFCELNFVSYCVFWNLFTEKKTISIEWQSYFWSSIGCEKKYSDAYWKEIEQKMKGEKRRKRPE